MEEMVRLVLPRGSQMCKWSSVHALLQAQDQELNGVGLQSSTDLLWTTLDISLVLHHRARGLLKEGLIKHGEELQVQVIAYASGIFNSYRTNGTVVVLKVISLRISDARCIVKL